MNPRGLFVTYGPFLDGGHGGVQACTREYVSVVQAAGVDLEILRFGADRRLTTRLLRQIDSSPYFRAFERGLPERILTHAAAQKPDFVFLNQVSLASLAPTLRAFLPPACRIVVLSHGLEITDLTHTLRLRGILPLSGRARPTPATLLGRVVLDETASRRDVDLVCALSPIDRDLEAALGCHRTGWLPRTIPTKPLSWRPVSGRFGYVGTLDHAPNLQGLVSVLDALQLRQSNRVTIRVVGGPGRIGDWLVRRYGCVEFLGTLDDNDLAAEATTWNAFLHPIFLSARGCSTKLAMAIGWRVPILTTPFGRRGYEWTQGDLIQVGNPSRFAEACIELTDLTAAAKVRKKVAQVAGSSPSLEEVAVRMRMLLSLSDPNPAGREGPSTMPRLGRRARSA